MVLQALCLTLKQGRFVVKETQQAKTTYLGDGINDAPALLAATAPCVAVGYLPDALDGLRATHRRFWSRSFMQIFALMFLKQPPLFSLFPCFSFDRDYNSTDC